MCLCDDHFLAPDAVAIPAYVKTYKAEKRGDLFGPAEPATEHINPNLSAAAIKYFADISVDVGNGPSLWMHVLAVGFSPMYLHNNSDGVRFDWARIPLPSSQQLLFASANLGAKLAALLDTETHVNGATSGPVRAELKVIGNLTLVATKPLDIVEDLKIKVGWGHKGKEGVTMPGQGKISERDYTAEEREAIAKGAASLGLTLEQALAQVGETTCDVYLNEHA